MFVQLVKISLKKMKDGIVVSLMWWPCSTFRLPPALYGVQLFTIQTSPKLMLMHNRDMKNIAKKFMMAMVQDRRRGTVLL